MTGRCDAGGWVTGADDGAVRVALNSAAGASPPQVGVHGLIIGFRDPGTGASRSATYLPEIAHREGWSRRYTVESLCRKAGFNVRGHVAS